APRGKPPETAPVVGGRRRARGGGPAAGGGAPTAGAVVLSPIARGNAGSEDLWPASTQACPRSRFAPAAAREAGAAGSVPGSKPGIPPAAPIIAPPSPMRTCAGFPRPSSATSAIGAQPWHGTLPALTLRIRPAVETRGLCRARPRTGGPRPDLVFASGDGNHTHAGAS